MSCLLPEYKYTEKNKVAVPTFCQAASQSVSQALPAVCKLREIYDDNTKLQRDRHSQCSLLPEEAHSLPVVLGDSALHLADCYFGSTFHLGLFCNASA